MNKERMTILVCGGTGCIASQSDEMVVLLKEKVEALNMEEEITVIKTGCFGFCGQGPIIKIQPDNVFYVQVQLSDIDEIMDEHIIKGRVVERLLFTDPKGKEKIKNSAIHSNLNF